MDSLASVAAILAAIISLGFAGAQAYWAMGGKWGLGGAWGGGYSVLPTRLRIGSAASTLVFIAAAALVLARADYWEPFVSSDIVRTGTWVFAGATVLSALGNFASSSKWERFMNGPIALVLAGLFIVVALSD